MVNPPDRRRRPPAGAMLSCGLACCLWVIPGGPNVAAGRVPQPPDAQVPTPQTSTLRRGATAGPEAAADSLERLLPADLEPAEIEIAFETLADRADHAGVARRPPVLTWTVSRSGDGRVRHRARFEAVSRRITLRADADHDPGERWVFRPRDGRLAWDHVTGYALWTPRAGARVVAGSYRWVVGHGLLLAAPRIGSLPTNGFAASRTGGRLRAHDPLRPYSGADEDRYLSGAAATLGSHRFRAGAFLSIRRLDAEPDSLQQPFALPVVPFRWRPGGDHASKLGLERRDRLLALLAGSSVSWSNPVAEIGLTLLVERYGEPMLLPSRTRVIALDRRASAGLAMRLSHRRVTMSGEVSLSHNSLAALGFMLLSSTDVYVLLGARRYPPGYAMLLASPPSFRSGTPGNESGFSIAVRSVRSSPLRAEAALDAACRIVVETRYATGGCRSYASASLSASSGGVSWEAVSSFERSRMPDRTDLRGEALERMEAGLSASFEIGSTLHARMLLAARRSTPGATVATTRDPWSSRLGARVRWEPTSSWRIEAGSVDHHVSAGILAAYQAPLPLASSLRTLSGDGTTWFAAVSGRSGRLSAAVRVAGTRQRHLPDDPWARRSSAIDLVVSLGVYPNGP